MRTIIDKSHYEEIQLKSCFKNKTKIQRERIGLREVFTNLIRKEVLKLKLHVLSIHFQ